MRVMNERQRIATTVVDGSNCATTNLFKMRARALFKVLSYQSNIYLTERSNRSKAKSLGCSIPPLLTNNVDYGAFTSLARDHTPRI